MTTVRDVLIYEALEKNKQYKEELKKKRLSDKVKVKIEKSKLKQSKKQVNTVTKNKIKNVDTSKGKITKNVKKKSETTLKKKKRIELLKRAKQVVYVRDKNICQHCGVACTGSNRHASHVIPVSATGRLALYPLNMKVMCYHCHINWWHKNPLASAKRFESKFPERVKELERLQLSIPMGSITLAELEKIEEMIEKDEKSLAI